MCPNIKKCALIPKKIRKNILEKLRKDYIEDRVKEHICNIRTKRENSLMFQHCRDNNHSMKFSTAKVII